MPPEYRRYIPATYTTIRKSASSSMNNTRRSSRARLPISATRISTMPSNPASANAGSMIPRNHPGV